MKKELLGTMLNNSTRRHVERRALLYDKLDALSIEYRTKRDRWQRELHELDEILAQLATPL